jgi:hypothetical protein
MPNTDYRDGFLVAAANATQGPFSLLGGKYGVTCAATFGGGSVALQILGPDASTFVTACRPSRPTAPRLAASQARTALAGLRRNLSARMTPPI